MECNTCHEKEGVYQIIVKAGQKTLSWVPCPECQPEQYKKYMGRKQAVEKPINQ